MQNLSHPPTDAGTVLSIYIYGKSVYRYRSVRYRYRLTHGAGRGEGNAIAGHTNLIFVLIRRVRLFATAAVTLRVL